MAFPSVPDPPSSHSAPHRADPRLVPATDATLEALARTGVRGFHGEMRAEDFEAERPVSDPARFFGFQVDGRWVSTCGSQDRVMTTPGGSVPVAAVTMVTVSPGYRRRGLLREMMHHQLTEVAQRGEQPLALLWASESGIYGRFGYGCVTPMAALSGRTEEMGFLPDVDLGGGSVDELSTDEFLQVAPQVHAALLPRRPGHLDRSEAMWQLETFDPEHNRHGAGPKRYAVHFTADGSVDGFATFRIKHDSQLTDHGREAVISDLDAAGPAGYARLWRWLFDLDLVSAFSRRTAPIHDPIRQLVANPRMIKTSLFDGTYARIVDVTSALRARTYATELDTVIEVADRFLPETGGRFSLRGGPEGATVERTSASPDLTVSTRQLSAGYLGAVSLTEFQQAGLLDEHTPGTAARISTAFASWHEPWCPDHF